ncbi:MAG TPA: O-antigen ligase family protein [Terriglobia bacterium]|nr:O-antigen ligase family protein [Terriglobia bacterium]
MRAFIEKIFAVAMLFYMTGAVFPYLESYAESRAVPARVGLAVAFYAIAAGFILLRWHTVLLRTWDCKWLVALALLAVVSSAWSQDSVKTVKYGLLYFAATLYGIYFGSRYSPREQLRLLGWACGLTVLASFMVVILLPKYGLDHGSFLGSWQGAFLQKNILARSMVLSVLVFYFLRQSIPNWVRWLGMGTSLALLVLSRSVTGSLVLTATLILVFLSRVLVRVLRERHTFSIPTLAMGSVLAAGAAFGVLQYVPDLLRLFGRDTTLTGRVGLWKAVLPSITKHLWLGYGFEAFWTGLKGESFWVISQIDWIPLHGHNFFVDLMLYLGVTGVAVFLIGYIGLWRRAVQISTRVDRPLTLWLLAYLVFMLVCNLDESCLKHPYTIFWVLYTSTAVTISMCATASRGAQTSAATYEY